MVSLTDARALIAKNISPLRATVSPLMQALGRVLRQDAVARQDLPAFDRSAMDGYAVAAGDKSDLPGKDVPR